MPSQPCAIHSDRTAVFCCDGCGAALCEGCVEESHRLLLCRRCGERALPLEAGAPATVAEARQARQWQSAAAYGLRDALRYAFRGTGAFAFWSLAALLLLAEIPILGALPRLFALLALLTLPAFLFTIARSTARGEDELPDWPELEPFSNIADLLRFLWVSAWCLLPAVLLLLAFGCGAEEAVAGCVPILAVGMFASAALWVLAFGSTALFESAWLSFRFDLHARLARVAGRELGRTVLLIGGLAALAPLVAVGAATVSPRLGWWLAETLLLYALFTGAHLTGVYFRRHPREVREIYLG